MRPSVRFVTSIGDFLKIGLSGGFGIGMKFGATTIKTYTWEGGKDAYMASANPYGNAFLTETQKNTPTSDVALYPNLGIGFSLNIVQGIFALNGGIGATQTLYRIRTSEVETTKKGEKTQKVPTLEQSWGKPLAQLALGATFNFMKNFSLDALFSTNGTSFDNANFVVQFSARF
jgi:hypothetical protein